MMLETRSTMAMELSESVSFSPRERWKERHHCLILLNITCKYTAFFQNDNNLNFFP